jgi:hypothetical protein
MGWTCGTHGGNLKKGLFRTLARTHEYNMKTVILKTAAEVKCFSTYCNRRLYFPKQDIDDKPHKCHLPN